MNRHAPSKEELVEFISGLRLNGYNIGAEQYVAAQRLLVNLVAQGDWLADPRRLQTMLGPILCSSRDEQASFPRLYERWLSTRPVVFEQARQAEATKAISDLSPTLPSALPIKKGAPPKNVSRLRLRWWGWASILGLAITLATLVYSLTDSTPPPTQHIISGRAMTVDGRPIPNATVTIGTTTIYTDADGRFSTSLPEAFSPLTPLSVSSSAPGVSESRIDVNTDAGNYSIPTTVLQRPVQAASPSPPSRVLQWLDENSGGLMLAGAILVGMIVLAVVTLGLLRLTRRMALRRWRTKENLRLDHLKVKGASEQLTRALSLRRTAQEMRRYQQVDARDLDVAKTIEETIRSGLFTPAYSFRKALSEYLMLIDRDSFGDQQARLLDEMMSRLTKNDVYVERFFFHNDPRICRREAPKPQFETLQELATQYPAHQLIVFSDGGGFFNPLNGRPHHWLETFALWPTRFLLTSDLNPGDYREAALSELGFRVLPGGKAGLAALTEAAGKVPAHPAAPLPPLIRVTPQRWLGNHPPPQATLDQLLLQLKEFLGEDGYYWLSACAVYPMLYLDLTIYLGVTLVGQDHLYERFTTLLRLPWFRKGSMPDWLRARLIFDLPAREEKAVRNALEELLLSSVLNPEDFVLPLARKPQADVPGLFGRLASWALKLRQGALVGDILASEPDDSKLKDYVLVSFMSGRRPSKLSLRLPEELRSVLYPDQAPVQYLYLMWLLTALILALSGGLLMILLLIAEPSTLLPGAIIILIWATLSIWSLYRVVSAAESPEVELPAEILPAEQMIEDRAPSSASLPIVRVYLSATWIDLFREYDAAGAAIHTLRETGYTGIEYTGYYQTSSEAVRAQVDRCQVFVGIFASLYGSGITEAEYRRARERDLPCFIYFKRGTTGREPWHAFDPEQFAKLDSFKQELRSVHIVKEFDTPEELKANIITDVRRWLFGEYLTRRLESGLRGEMPRAETELLLAAIRDMNSLGRDLLGRLQQAGYSHVIGRAVGDIDETQVTSAPPPTVSARHQLRSPVSDFVGRAQEVGELTESLRRGASAAVSGMGGVGKTELALFVADKIRDAYPDAQLFIDMLGTDGQPLDPADALAHCVRAFKGIEQKLPANLEELTALYRDTLDGKRALIFLDNAFDSAQVRPLLPPAGSALFVTSREVLTLPGMTSLGLEPLQPAEARQLLMRISPRVGEHADEIAKLCGYLPLALRLAGTALTEGINLGAGAYARRLSVPERRLKLIEASIGHSYDKLTPELQRLWRGLAVFPETFDEEAAAALLEIGILEARDRLGELVRRNLLEKDATTARYRLHELLRIFADSRLGERESAEHQRLHASVYLHVVQRAGRLYEEGGDAAVSGLALFDLEWPNIQAGWTWAEKEHGSDDPTAQGLCSNYPKAAELLLDLRQHPRERIRWLEVALAAARELNDVAAEVSHLGGLGVAFLNLGTSSRARLYFEQQLESARMISDRRGEAHALSNLGLVDESPNATWLFEQSLTIARKIGDHRNEARALSNLGSAYIELGEARRAIEFFERSLVIARKSGDLRLEGQIHVGLGRAYGDLNDNQLALDFYERSLARAREIGDLRVEGEALFNTGLAHSALGNLRQSITYSEHALKILEHLESPLAVRVRKQLARWRKLSR